MMALACALLGGAMFYLSQGMDDVWALAWFAPAPLLWLAYGKTSGWRVFLAALAAYAAGQIYFLPVYGVPLLPTVLAMMLGNGALFGGAVLFARRVRRLLPPAAALLAFPALWTGLEYLEGWVSPHGSWGALGYSQVSFPAAIQIAALLGLYAVSFLVCLFANALALAARGAREAGAAGILLCALSMVFGVFQLAAPQTAGMKVAALSDFGARKVAVRKLDLARTLAMTREYAAAARDAAAKGARLIVIPEGAVAADPKWLAAAIQPLAEVARQQRVTIVIGAVTVNPWRNVALALTPDGMTHSYDKRHLLPPFENIFTPGRGPGLIGAGRAMAICKDMDFPRTLRADARAADNQQGIRVMAVPAGDFVGDGWIHARMAIMRGVENGFAMVRSAFKGVETVSDAQGRVIARADTNRPGLTAIAATVEPGGGPTLYTQIGDVFAWMCVLLSLGLGLLTTRAGGQRP